MRRRRRYDVTCIHSAASSEFDPRVAEEIAVRRGRRRLRDPDVLWGAFLGRTFARDGEA